MNDAASEQARLESRIPDSKTDGSQPEGSASRERA